MKFRKTTVCMSYWPTQGTPAQTDVNDAQWIQRLHACGLLRASFHPAREIAVLRSHMRLRERHLDYAAAHIRHMQKALTHMNLQLHHVVPDVTVVTGMRIIRAIVAGERDAAIVVDRTAMVESLQWPHRII